jgi:hypothetical protein
LGALRKALTKAGMWPPDAEGDDHTASVGDDGAKTATDDGASSSTDSTTSSSHASLYIRSATLTGAPLTRAAVTALQAWGRSSGEPCTYTLVFEPVLRMASVRVWLHRLAAAHTKTTLEQVHARVPLVSEADAVMYAHDLVDTVLAVQGPLATRAHRRQRTQRVNLDRCTWAWSAETLAELDRCVATCTRSEDHPSDQQAWYDVLYRTLATALKQGGPAIHQRLDFDDDRVQWTPLEVQRARGERFGFVHLDDTADHGCARPVDRLLVDVPSTVLYATQTELSFPSHSLVDTVYTQPLQRPLVEALVGAPKADDFLFQLVQGRLRAHLNRTRLPVHLYQLFNQLETSATFPVLALYHQTPGLARRVLRLKYHEAKWDPQTAGHHRTHAPAPTTTLLDAYTHYVETQSTRLWMERHTADVAHFLDVVVHVKPHYYLCVLDRTGTMDAHVVPWHTMHTTRLRKPTGSLPVSMKRFVDRALPRVNRWLRGVNRVRYPVVLHARSPSGPDLMQWSLTASDDRLRAGAHVHLQQYTSRARFRCPRPCAVEALRASGYAFLPTPTTTPALATNPPVSLRQLWARLGHGSEASRVLRDRIHGREATGASSGDVHARHNRFYATNNRDTLCALWLRSGCHRFGVDDRTGYHTLARAVPLRVNLMPTECLLSVGPSAYRLPKHVAPSNHDHPVHPLHPSVLYEWTVLLAYGAHLFQQSSAWPRLQRALLAADTGGVTTEAVDRCPLPVVAAPQGERLANIKATIGKDRYQAHLAKCTSEKGRYNRVCQKDNQPWCVPATTTVSFRRWCRYACVPPEFDEWASADTRQRLRLHASQTVFRGPYRIQYDHHNTHPRLAHNLFKLQRLPFAEAACDVLKTTLTRLILECNQAVHPQAPTPTVTSEDIRLEWFHKAVGDTALLRRAMKLHRSTFPDEPLPVLPEWVRHYGRDAATWRMWVHLAQRFAQTLYYLPHPYLRTASREPIHFCCPTYLCGQCKVPMADPETPAYYYADPPSTDDVAAALREGGRTEYQHRPIVEAAVRRGGARSSVGPPDGRAPLDYASGDARASVTRALVWAHTTDATKRDAQWQQPAPRPDALYGPFGTVLPLTALDGLPLRVTFRGAGVYEVTVRTHNDADEPAAPTRWTFRRLATAAKTAHAAADTYVVRKGDAYTVTTTTAQPPGEGTAAKVCTSLPATFDAQVACVAVHVPAPATVPATHLMVDEDDAWTASPFLVLRTGAHTATVVDRPTVPVCVRFRQFRAVDPLKTVRVPSGLVADAAKTTSVVLTGMAQYAPARVEKTVHYTKRLSRKQRRDARKQARPARTARTRPNRPKRPNRGGGAKARGRTASDHQDTAHTVRVTLAEALRRGMVEHRPDADPEYETLTLRWGLCRAWSLTFADAPTYQRVTKCNRDRTTTCVKKVARTTLPLVRTGLSFDAAGCAVCMDVNDDRWYECPRCGVANHVRNFFWNHGAKYGQIVGIKEVPAVGTDPDWMYVSSYKLVGAKLNPRNYERLWNRAPERSHDEYRIPLGVSTVAKSARPKAFNCNVQKVTRTDTFTVQSFNLQTLLEQPPATGDASANAASFVVTGTVPVNSAHTRSTLHSLWECLTEETIDRAWVDTQLTTTHLLNLGGGRLVATHGDGAADAPPKDIVGPAVRRTRAYLQQSLHADTALSGDLLCWWELMATMGYDPRSRYAAKASPKRAAVPLSVFMLDVRQTPDGNNFAPRVLIPPYGDLARVVWDPRADDDAGEPAHTSPSKSAATDDLLLFSVALKVQCSATYADAFYVLRPAQRAQYAPIFVCARSRVRLFLQEGVSTFDEARASYRATARTATTSGPVETEQMYVCALLYCKLYREMVDACVQRWHPHPVHAGTRTSLTGARASVTPALVARLVDHLRHKGYEWRHQVCVDPSTYQIRQLVFWHGSTQFRLPVCRMAWTDACRAVADRGPNDRFVTVSEAERCLASLGETLGGRAAWTVQRHVVDAFGRTTALQLGSGGHVPVDPAVPPASARRPPTTPMQAAVHHDEVLRLGQSAAADSGGACHTAYTHVWDDFLELCEVLATHFQRRITALDSTCKVSGSVPSACLLFRLREQVDALLHTPPRTLSADLRDALRTDRRYVRLLAALFDHYILYADASSVRSMVVHNQTAQLRKLFAVRAPAQTSADTDEAVRAAPPAFDFPAANTVAFYERQTRQPTDTLYHTLLQRREEQATSTSDDAVDVEERLGFLPAPWAQTFLHARVTERDGFTVLAEGTGVNKQYLSEQRGRRVCPLETVVAHLKFPAYLLNEPRVVGAHLTKPPRDPTQSPAARGPVMYARPVTTCFPARLADGGREVHTPDLPAFVEALWTDERAARRPLRILYHPGTPQATPVACTVDTLQRATKRDRWHVLRLDAPVRPPTSTAPAPGTRTRARPTWRLDPGYYHVARYHLVKAKVPHKPKLKNLQPAEVERVMGVDTPWLAPSPPPTPATLRYYVHL